MIATGEPHTVRDFVTEAYACAGRPIEWSGEGLKEIARFVDSGGLAAKVESELVRKPLVDRIISDPRRLYTEYGFQRKSSFRDLIQTMVQHDIDLQKTETNAHAAI